MIRSIALAVTWSGDRSARLRSVILAAATMVVTGIALVAISAGLLAERVNDRAIARAFQPAADDQPADLSRGAQFDSLNGEPLFVYYWRIETPGVTIPGLPENPELGQWFLSPELHRRSQSEPVLTGRFGDNPAVIADDGVGAADELIAYRLVGPEVELSERLTSEPGFDWIGLDAGISGTNVLLGAFGLVLIVGIGFLRAALGPVTVGLERRLQTLHILGASRATLARLSFASAAVVALPAAVVAAVAWYLIAPNLRQVPLVDEPALAGDLAVPLWLALATGAAATLLAGALSLRHLSRRVGSRPTSRIPSPPTLWRAVPLAGSLALILFATVLSGSGAVRLLLTGLLAAALGVTFALPVVVDRLGAAIAGGNSPLALLVGRRLSWNAATAARPLLALAGLAVLVPVAASYIAVAREGDPPPPPSTVTALRLQGPVDAPTLAQLEREADGAFVDVYVGPLTPQAPPTFTWVGNCDKLSNLLVVEQCGPDAIVVSRDAAAAFIGLDASSTTPPPGHDFAFRLLVTTDQTNAERVLRAFVVNSERIDLAVTTQADQEPKEARVVAWIIAGIQIAAVGAFSALLLSVSTSASQSARTRLRLIAFGARLNTIRRLAAAESFIIVAAVGLGGTAVGTVGAVAYALVDGTVDPNYTPSAIVATASVAAAALAALTSASHITPMSAQSALNNAD